MSHSELIQSGLTCVLIVVVFSSVKRFAFKVKLHMCIYMDMNGFSGNEQILHNVVNRNIRLREMRFVTTAVNLHIRSEKNSAVARGESLSRKRTNIRY